MTSSNVPEVGTAANSMSCDDLLKIVAVAVAELDDEHSPQWFNARAEEEGKKPIGCVVCFPQDGKWPCTSRMIADDLRALMPAHSELDTGDPS